VGSSGSGKTSALLNLISKCQDTFGAIHVVYKSSEPLYEYMESVLNKKNKKHIFFYTKLADLPSINNFPGKELAILLVFDDQVNESEANQQIIKEYFIRGRKINGGISLAYLSQSYFKIPRIIRLQFSYLLLLKLSSARDLNMILSECSLGDKVDKTELHEVYEEATKDKFCFLKINLDTTDEDKKFSKNFSDFFTFK
jgi:hypothetical protein